MNPVVTFDVFSALTDSHAGGSSLLQTVVDMKGWPVTGIQLYERWDTHNKELHRTHGGWALFRDISAMAMHAALTELILPDSESAPISQTLLDSMAEWPLWPDVSPSALTDIGAAGLGLLSNIDNGLLQDTAAMRLGVFDPHFIVTSQRAHSYKPAAAFYHRAIDIIGPLVHVASSERDVKGALEADIPCIRLARPRHSLDTTGPAPRWTADSISTLPSLVAAIKDRHATKSELGP